MSRIRISHDLSEVAKSDTARTLVLKDTSVLDESEGSDNEVVNMEDVELAEREKFEKLKRRSKHGKSANAYEDEWDEFQSTSVLSKYDDFDKVEADRIAARSTELVVGEDMGTASGERQTDSNFDASADMSSGSMVIGGSAASKTAWQSEPTTLSFQSDFFSEKEAKTVFKKISSKKRKARKHSDDEGDDFKPTAGTVSLHSAEQDEELHAQLARIRRIEMSSKIQMYNENDIANSVRQTTNVEETSSVVADFLSRISTAREDAFDSTAVVNESTSTHRASPDPEPVPSHTSADVSAPTPDQVMEEPLSALSVPSSVGGGAAEMLPDVKVDSGLACALKFFSSRGAVESRSASELKDDVRIDHRDESGRILNPKEAYKQLSWKFHGVKPSAAKLEKMRAKNIHQ